MILSSYKIKKAISDQEIHIVPFEESHLKGASYTFTLDSRIKVLKAKEYLDSREDPEFEETQIDDTGYQLEPGSFAIFYTREKITLNGKYVCIITTRPTIAHMGLNVTQDSFLAEPDTDNQFALEISNQGPLPVRLYPGTKIVKGIFVPIS